MAEKSSTHHTAMIAIVAVVAVVVVVIFAFSGSKEAAPAEDVADDIIEISDEEGNLVGEAFRHRVRGRNTYRLTSRSSINTLSLTPSASVEDIEFIRNSHSICFVEDGNGRFSEREMNRAQEALGMESNAGDGQCCERKCERDAWGRMRCWTKCAAC